MYIVGPTICGPSDGTTDHNLPSTRRTTFTLIASANPDVGPTGAAATTPNPATADGVRPANKPVQAYTNADDQTPITREPRKMRLARQKGAGNRYQWLKPRYRTAAPKLAAIGDPAGTIAAG
jgi:hypothetical protein